MIIKYNKHMPKKNTTKKFVHKKASHRSTFKKPLNKIANKPSKIINKLKGMKDIMPEEYKYWDLVTRKAVELAKLYSYKRLDLPFLENTMLYERTCGKNSDLVGKELYSYVTKANERIALRPDTAPGLIRAVLEHSAINPGEIFKSLWLGSVVRYDRSQGGRLRQFNQFSLNVLGNSFGPSADAQLILIGYNFFKELQVDIEVHINSLGCPDCANNYLEVIKDYFKERGKKAKLSAEAKKVLQKNTLQILTVKDEKCQEIIDEIPPIVDHLCDGCRKHLEVVLEYLDSLSIPYYLDTSLIASRGFNCYHNTIFEFVPIIDGVKSVPLGGGGNFSIMADKMGDYNLKACGFGIDLEKTISKIRGKNIALLNGEQADVFIAQISDQAKCKTMLLFEELRRAGFKVRENFIQDSLKLQLEEAEKVKVKYTLILGQKELLDNTIMIRDMESGVQETIDIRKVVNELDKRLNIS